MLVSFTPINTLSSYSAFKDADYKHSISILSSTTRNECKARCGKLVHLVEPVIYLKPHGTHCMASWCTMQNLMYTSCCMASWCTMQNLIYTSCLVALHGKLVHHAEPDVYLMPHGAAWQAGAPCRT